MAEVVLYREFHTLRWLTWGLGVVSILLLFYAILRQQAPANGWLILGAFVGFFASQYLAVIHRVNRITLTDTQLHVGRETFDRSDIDFSFGVQPPLVLSPDEEQRVNEDWPVPHDLDVRIAGGAWGRRRGTATIVLKEANREQVVAIFTRHPTKLDEFLTAWLETPPET